MELDGDAHGCRWATRSRRADDGRVVLVETARCPASTCASKITADRSDHLRGARGRGARRRHRHAIDAAVRARAGRVRRLRWQHVTVDRATRVQARHHRRRPAPHRARRGPAAPRHDRAPADGLPHDGPRARRSTVAPRSGEHPSHDPIDDRHLPRRAPARRRGLAERHLRRRREVTVRVGARDRRTVRAHRPGRRHRSRSARRPHADRRRTCTKSSTARDAAASRPVRSSRPGPTVPTRSRTRARRGRPRSIIAADLYAASVCSARRSRRPPYVIAVENNRFAVAEHAAQPERPQRAGLGTAGSRSGSRRPSSRRSISLRFLTLAVTAPAHHHDASFYRS